MRYPVPGNVPIVMARSLPRPRYEESRKDSRPFPWWPPLWGIVGKTGRRLVSFYIVLRLRWQQVEDAHDRFGVSFIDGQLRYTFFTCPDITLFHCPRFAFLCHFQCTEATFTDHSVRHLASFGPSPRFECELRSEIGVRNWGQSTFSCVSRCFFLRRPRVSPTRRLPTFASTCF